MLVRHQVRQFDAWKAVYDAHRPSRERAGLQDIHLWRNMDRPDEIVLLFEASDVGRAREFVASADLRQAMEDAGVIGAPELVFLDPE